MRRGRGLETGDGAGEDRRADDAGFDAFVAASAGRLHRLAYTWCHDWHLADDLVQTTYEKVYRAWHRIEADDPYGYARTTMLRSFLHDRRRAARAQEQLTSTPPEVLSGEDGAPLRLDLLAAVARLAPRQRVVVVLRYVEDLSTEETAAAMGISVGTVKSTLHDARVVLRRHLSDDTATATRGAP